MTNRPSTWITLLGALLLPSMVWAGPALRIGVIPVADVLPLYAGVEQGYFAAEKLEVEMVNLASGTRIVEGLAGGSLDIGLSATLAILQAAQQGLDLIIVEPAAFMRRDRAAANGLMVSKAPGVTSPAGLKGKTIGVNALNNINYLMTVELLARSGVGAKDVTWREVSFPQMPAALENRSVDAVSIVEPFLTILRDSGKGILLSPGQDVVPGISMSALAALRPWSEKNRERLAAFDRAYKKGIAWCNREPERARELLAKYAKTPPDIAGRITLHAYRAAIEPAELLSLAALAKRYGLLEGPPDIDRILAPTARGR